MNRIPDFSSLISSPPFTFLVGKDHTKLTIQSGLAKHVSKPLDDLMNNGHTRESKHRIAVLEDEEVEVFTAFTQYAYTGNYTVPAQTADSSNKSSSNSTAAPEPPSAVSPRSGSGSSNGLPDVRNGRGRNAHSPIDESVQQQQEQPAMDSAIARTHSSASFLPPPAPTPPPFGNRYDARLAERRYAETPLAIMQTSEMDDQWDNPFAPATEHHNLNYRDGSGFRENVPPVENKREVVVIQERQQEPSDDDTEPSFPLSRRPSRKEKRKKRKDTIVAASRFDETATKSLTPPSTPPFDLKDTTGKASPPKRAVPHMVPRGDPDCAIETDTGEEGDIDGDDGDWWDKPVTSQNFSRKRDINNDALEARGQLPQMPTGPTRQQQVSPSRLSPTASTTTTTEQQRHHTAPFIDTAFASHPMSSTPQKKGSKSWNEFASIDYFHRDRSEGSGAATPTPLQTIVVPYILFHAKVYVFATRYLIPGLAQLCLQKLHASLVDYPLDPPDDNEEDYNDSQRGPSRSTSRQDVEILQFNAHARMFLDILKYTYENTTRFEPESQTSATLLRECELRKLVAQYAACKMRELAVYTPAPIPVPSSPSQGPGSGVSAITAPGGGLRELLDRLPELASDLVFLMM